MFNYYKSITKSSTVLGSIELDQFLYTIKNGDKHLEQIKRARAIYNLDKEAYKFLKRNKLPCYTLNFRFNKTRKNTNIVDSTGFIYLDVDGATNINLSNPLVFASWLSLSGNGRGVLVKVDNIDSGNFKIQYNEIAKALDVDADEGACKATQPNVLSYDPNLYVNYDSEKWLVEYKESNETEKAQHSTNTKTTNTIATVVGSYESPLRFDNLRELIENVEFNGDVIHDFRTKVQYSRAMIPFNGIPEGKRNTTLIAIAYQIRALNKSITHETLFRLMRSINTDHCIRPISLTELNSIVSYAIKQEASEPIKNAERRFVFNSDYELTAKEKRQSVMKIINQDRVKQSKLIIENAIEQWDFISDGSITQKGLASKAKMNIKTIKKYYPLYKSEIQCLNKEYRKNNKSP